MLRLSKRSLTTQLMFALICVIVSLVVTLGWVIGQRERANLIAQSRQQYEATLQTVGSTLTDAIVAEDIALMRETTKRLSEDDPNILSLEIRDQLGQTLIDSGSSDARSSDALHISIITRSIELAGDVIGELELTLNIESIYAEVERRVFELRVALLLALSVVALLVALLLYPLVISPLKQIDEQVQALQANPDQEQLQLRGALEFERVGAAIDRYMLQAQEQRVLDRQHRRELERLNEAYRRFVPQQFLTYLERDEITQVTRGDQVAREMTVLFCDVRSFTTLSERLGAQGTFDLINELLSYLGPVIRLHGGIVDKYIGDAIMALFDNASDAVEASADLMRQLERFNAPRRAAGEPEVQIGVGLNSGSLMLGVIGEDERLDGTVIGDVVNLSSRLEGLTKKYRVPILISEDTVAALCEERGVTLSADAIPQLPWALRFVDLVQAKGRVTLTPIYELLSFHTDAERDERLALSRWHQAQLNTPVNVAIPLPAGAEDDPLLPLYQAQLHQASDTLADGLIDEPTHAAPQDTLEGNDTALDAEEEILWS